MRTRRLVPRASWDIGCSERIDLRNRMGFGLGFVDVCDDGRYYPYSFRTNQQLPRATSLLSASHAIIATHEE
jgi:hypothetical protein